MKKLLLTLTITLLGNSAFAQTKQFECRLNTNVKGQPIIRIWGYDGENWLKVGKQMVFSSYEERAKSLTVCESYANNFLVSGVYNSGFTVQYGFVVFFKGVQVSKQWSRDIYPILEEAAESIKDRMDKVLN